MMTKTALLTFVWQLIYQNTFDGETSKYVRLPSFCKIFKRELLEILEPSSASSLQTRLKDSTSWLLSIPNTGLWFTYTKKTISCLIKLHQILPSRLNKSSFKTFSLLITDVSDKFNASRLVRGSALLWETNTGTYFRL